MNKFQKIAVFLIRLLGVLCLLFGVNGFFYTLILAFSQNFQIDGMSGAQGMMSGAFYFIWGLVFILFSGPLGNLIGRGLDD